MMYSDWAIDEKYTIISINYAKMIINDCNEMTLVGCSYSCYYGLSLKERFNFEDRNKMLIYTTIKSDC